MGNPFIQIIDRDKPLPKDWFENEHGQDMLKRLRENKRSGQPIGHCCCKETDRAPLNVVRTKRGRFAIKNFPGKLSLHHPRCTLGMGVFQTRPGNVDQAGVITSVDDTTFRVTLRNGVSRGAVQVRQTVRTNVDNAPGNAWAGQRRISPSYLLDFLWELAEFHFWSPKMLNRRNQFTLQKYLKVAAERIQCTRQLTFKDVFEPMLVRQDEVEIQEIWDRAHKQKRRMYLLLPFEFREQNYDDAYLCTSWLRKAGIRVRADIALYDRMLDHLTIPRHEENAVRFAFLQVEAHSAQNPKTKRTSKFFRVIDGSIRAFSQTFLPVHSSYELAVTDLLVDQGRLFSKPVVRTNFKYLPDFVLHDVPGEDCPMEVFGFTSAQYLEQKRLKTEYYNQELGKENWWFWDPHTQRDIPPLPESGTESEADPSYG